MEADPLPASRRPLRPLLLLLLVAAAPVGAGSGGGLVALADGLGGVGAIASHGDVAVVATSSGALWRLVDGAIEPLAQVPLASHKALELDADASPYFLLGGGWHRLEGGALVPVTEAMEGLFGPDGRLHVLATPDWDLHAVDGERRWGDAVDLPCCGRAYAFGPDGRFYHLDQYSGALTAIDVATGASERLGTLPAGAYALTLDSLGRVYHVNPFRGTLARYDPATGAYDVLATGIRGDASHLAWWGSRLLVTIGVADASLPVSDGVAYLETGVQGFDGFRSRFDLAPLADLRPEVLEERASANGGREFVVRVSNEGGSWARGGWRVSAEHVSATLACAGANGLASTCARDETHLLIEHDMAPGEALTFAVRYAPGELATQESLRVVADPDARRLEADEGDNVAERGVRGALLRGLT